MIESQVVKGWERQGEIRGKVEMLLRVLGKKFGALPEQIAHTIRGANDADQLDRWNEIAALVSTFDQFRQDAGL